MEGNSNLEVMDKVPIRIHNLEIELKKSIRELINCKVYSIWQRNDQINDNKINFYQEIKNKEILNNF